MKSFLSLSGVLLVGLSLFVGIGVGIGLRLNWLLPAIGALIGIVALAFALQTLTRLMELPVEVEEDEVAAEPGNVAYVIEELGKKGKQRRKGGGH